MIMNIDRLAYFVDLAETLNFSETAERMYTTQGNVSKQIAALEKELQTTLFVRKHRTIQLNTSGQIALLSAKKILTAYQELLDNLKEVNGQLQNQLIIHGIPSFYRYQAGELIGRFHHEFNQYQIQFQEVETTQLLTDVLEDRCQVAVYRSFTPIDDSQFKTIKVDKDHLVVAMHRNHPLAEKASLDFADLHSEHFIQLGAGSRYLAIVKEECRNAGFEPVVDYQGHRLEVLMNLVAKNLGISVVMNQTIEHPDIVKVPLNKQITSEILFVRKNEPGTTLLELFWHYLENSDIKYSNME